MKKQPWSDEQIALLVKHYPTAEPQALVNMLGRSWALIKAKARKIPIARGNLDVSKKLEQWESRLNDIVDSYTSGTRIEELCEEFDISTSKLYDLFRKHNIDKKSTPVVFDCPDAEFIECYKTMRTLDIAAKYSVSVWCVVERAKKLNLGESPLRHKREALFSDDQLADIKHKYTVEGLSVKAIAELYKVCNGSIYRRVKENGWTQTPKA